MNSYSTESQCPHCGYKVEMSTNLSDERKPIPGSITFCIQCVKLSVFDENLQLRLPTAQENKDFKTDKRLARIREVMITYKKMN